MGGYLSEPIKDKESSDFEGERLICGASSMQGWRATQEDAHNCFIDYDGDKTASLFAVYDGHGGHEVAKYCEKHLPDYIKETEAYKKGDYEKALIDAFLGFDATLATPEIITILKQIAGNKEGSDKVSEAEDDEEEENVKKMYEEARMPLDQLMARYREEGTNIKFNSPCLRMRASGSGGAGTSSSPSASKDGEVSSSSAQSSPSKAAASPSGSGLTNGEVVMNGNAEEVNGVSSEAAAGSSSDKCEKGGGDGGGPCSTTSAASGPATSTSSKPKEDQEPVSSSQSNGTAEKSVSSSNGKVIDTTDNDADKISSSSPDKKFVKRSITLTRKLLGTGDDDTSDSDSDDENFEGGGISDDDDDDDDDDEDDDGEKAEGKKDGEDGEEDDDDEEEADTEEDEEEEEEEEAMDFGMSFKEEPGADSGCTAVVALLVKNALYVANAGDSRCVVCRDGKAIEMSIDHKPEDQVEMERIVAAGGEVTREGRVNGGLNLSRAIGDHTYKQVTRLPATEQMITALPDVKKLEMDPVTDEFVVLACDGIWNFMSSQNVVDFIRPRLQDKSKKISSICEELFDHCLAPDTYGDGTGCDNMTCIIVQFKPDGITNGHEAVKRPASPANGTVEESAKRPKLADEGAVSGSSD